MKHANATAAAVGLRDSGFREQAAEAARRFVQQPLAIRELGDGNINATFVVETGSRRIVLQRINRGVFPDPRAVVRNFVRITACLSQACRESGGPYLVPQAIPTRDDQLLWEDRDGGIWRAQTFIDGRAEGRVEDRERVRAIGRCLGWFHRLTAAIDSGDYEIPLPGFHVLPQYLAEYDRMAGETGRPWMPAERRCQAAVEEMRPSSPLFQRLLGERRLRPRIVHGDPKVDNFLFAATGGVLSLIDLDTVGPGLLHHDLGDCLRSCCNRGGERGGTRAVAFDLGSCRAFRDGYMAEMGDALARDDRQLVFDAVLLITFELALRFFTDHLQGDRYFRVRRRGENLQRAATQFALLASIRAQEEEIRRMWAAE